MAHIQQQEFCTRVKEQYKDFFRNKLVLDIGSLDINGNNQEYFYNCNYIGIDIAEGRNVDMISKGHELGFPDATFDVIISTECFEHDKYYELTIKNIYRMLKPGGLFLFTCATTGRPEHGTRRTTPEDAPLLQNNIEWSDYYKNLTESDIREILNIEESFLSFEFSTNEVSQDLYFYGFKIGIHRERDDYSFLLKNKPEAMRYYCQLYIDNGNGFSENLSQKISIEKNQEVKNIIYNLSEYDGINSLRLDPLNDACVVQFFNFEAILSSGTKVNLMNSIDTNACYYDGYNYFFNTNDSQIYLSKIEQINELKITLKYQFIGKKALEECISQKDYQLSLEEKKISKLTNELESIYNNKICKALKKMQSVINIFKKSGNN